MKKLVLILLLLVGMSLSFAAIGMVMLFATGVVGSIEDVRSLLMGEMAGAGAPPEVGEIVQEQDALLLLQKQKQELQQELLNLEDQRQALAQTKQLRSDEIGDLSQQGQTGQQDQAKLREERLKQLVVLYNAMRADQAAAIMDQMPDEMILEILPRLKERQAARILSSLGDEKRRADPSAQILSGSTGK